MATQEIFEKFATMDKVSGWMDTMNTLFNKQEYGTDLASVRQLLSAFNESFTVIYESKKTVRDLHTHVLRQTPPQPAHAHVSYSPDP